MEVQGAQVKELARSLPPPHNVGRLGPKPIYMLFIQNVIAMNELKYCHYQLLAFDNYSGTSYLGGFSGGQLDVVQIPLY